MVELLGTIKPAKELGLKAVPSQKYIWAACVDCGKERWVQLRHNKPQSARCVQCAWRIIGKKQTSNQYGENNPSWKGGQYLDRHGYIQVRWPNHPRANTRGYVKRAILVLEQKLGRPLFLGMDTHHINGIKDDDRPENLMELPNGDHKALTNKELKKAEHMMKFRHPK